MKIFIQSDGISADQSEMSENNKKQKFYKILKSVMFQEFSRCRWAAYVSNSFTQVIWEVQVLCTAVKIFG